MVPHNDVAAVSTALAGAGGRRAMVLTESVYSVLGDAAPLLELAGVCASYDALLVVDEAHGLGVAGAGGRGLVRRPRPRRPGPRRRHRHPVQGARRPGRRGARLPRRGRAPGQPGPAVHLRHRPRAGRRPRGALAALERADRATRAARRWSHDAGRGAGRGAGRRRARAARCCRCRCRRPRSRSPPRRRRSTRASGSGCFRPPSVPDGISRLRITTNAGHHRRRLGARRRRARPGRQGVRHRS